MKPSAGRGPERIKGAESAVFVGIDNICFIIFLNCVSKVRNSVGEGKYISKPYNKTGKTYVRNKWIEVSGSYPFSPCRPLAMRL